MPVVCFHAGMQCILSSRLPPITPAARSATPGGPEVSRQPFTGGVRFIDGAVRTHPVVSEQAMQLIQGNDRGFSLFLQVPHCVRITRDVPYLESFLWDCSIP